MKKQILPRLRSKKEALKILEIIRLAITGKTTLGRVGDAVDSSPFKVLISTMLSARTKDPVTEASSQRLFARFPDIESLAKADHSDVAQIIRPVLYHNVKGRRVVEVSKILLERFSGNVPKTLEGLTELPGVGRKTANCVLVYGFGVPAIPVDVHVHRVSNRIGLVRTLKPEETETKLSGVYDRKYWLDVNELFVRFGQTICRPVRPLCPVCPVNRFCNFYDISRHPAPTFRREVRPRSSPSARLQ